MLYMFLASAETRKTLILYLMPTKTYGYMEGMRVQYVCERNTKYRSDKENRLVVSVGSPKY